MIEVGTGVAQQGGASEAMRLIHTSDWHLGRRLFDQDLLGAAGEFLDWLLTQARRHDVDAVVVAGDVYDRAIPPVAAVELLNRAVTDFARAGIPLLMTSGNHDSAVRLGFGSELAEAAGIHLRTSVADLDRPLLLTDEHGEVGIYGIPYLLPDAVMRELGCDRSHAAVLAAAVARIRADAAARGLTRTVVAAHAFVTGAAATESERDIRVGGVADAGAEVFAGLGYVALGHLHRRQQVRANDGTTVAYSGSPLAYSFSERDHVKSVDLVDLDARGGITRRALPTPVPRPLREVRGRLEDLLTAGADEPAEARQAWVRAVLTDPSRPLAPLERLRTVWPHTLALQFEPEGGPADAAADLARLATLTDPVEICSRFVEFVDNDPPGPAQLEVLRRSVEAAQAAP
jgi:exonuclease SbcD